MKTHHSVDGDACIDEGQCYQAVPIPGRQVQRGKSPEGGGAGTRVNRR